MASDYDEHLETSEDFRGPNLLLLRISIILLYILRVGDF